MNSDRMSMRHTLAAHALTAGVTLLAMAILFGGRLGLIRQPPAVQIPVLDQEPEPPSPVPVPRDFRGSTPAVPIPDAKTPAPPEDVLKELDPEERNNVMVYATVNKSVVNITTESEGMGFFGDETSTGTGSGFVIDKQGHLLTNYHVIQGAGARPGDPVRRLEPRGEAGRAGCLQRRRRAPDQGPGRQALSGHVR